MAAKKFNNIGDAIKNSLKLASEAEDVKLSKGNMVVWRGVVDGLKGRLLLRGIPYFGIVLEDETDTVQCNMIDVAGCLALLITLIGELVQLNRAHIIVERYTLKSSKSSVPLVYLELSPRELTTLNVGAKRTASQAFLSRQGYIAEVCAAATSVKAGASPRDECTVADDSLASTACDEAQASWCQALTVQHVSAPLLVQDKVICFLLASFQHERKTQELWIVLTGALVAWRTLLVPNRTYILTLPGALPTDFFSRCSQPMGAVFPRSEGQIGELLHHPSFWPTMNTVLLPQSAKLSLSSQQRRVHPVAHWVPVGESLNTESEIVSVYGMVKDLIHQEPLGTSYGGCSLCPTARLKENTNMNTTFTSMPPAAPHPWVDPWAEDLPHIDQDLPISITKRVPLGHGRIKLFGLPGNLTRGVVLAEPSTGHQVTIYVRNWNGSLYAGGLSPGITLVMSFVNKRQSTKANVYYASCALTSFTTLQQSPVDTTDLEGWGRYGFPWLVVQPYEKCWGSIDMASLTSVSLSVVCNSCNSVFSNGRCPTQACHDRNTCRMKASAEFYVPVNKSEVSRRLLLQDNDVRIALDFNITIWRNLTIAAKRKPLVYRKYETSEELAMASDLEKLFSRYCRHMCLQRRFHVSARQLRQRPGNEKLTYICTHITSLDSHRLAIMLDNVHLK